MLAPLVHARTSILRIDIRASLLAAAHRMPAVRCFGELSVRVWP
jgi:hypothetical protein